MRNAARFSASIVAFALCACASVKFRQVTFAGEGSAASTAPPGGRTVHVVRNTSMTDTLLEMRIRYKLEEFLLGQGYTLAPADTADLYVLATFGAGEMMVPSIAPVYRSAGVQETTNREGTVTRKKWVPEHIEYLRLPLMKNSVWLQVLSSDARYFRQTGQVRNLWRGESASLGRPDMVGEYVAYLMVPALKYFGKPTSDVLTVDVREKEALWPKQ